MTPQTIVTRIKNYNLCDQISKTSIQEAMQTLIDQTPFENKESMRHTLSWLDIDDYCSRFIKK